MSRQIFVLVLVLDSCPNLRKVFNDEYEHDGNDDPDMPDDLC